MLNATCIPCQHGNHDACQVGQAPPKGMMGGWRCACPCRAGKGEAVPEPSPVHDHDLVVRLRHVDADALMWWIEETSIYRDQIAPERTTNLRWENVEEAARRIEAVADMARRGIEPS